MPTANSQRSLLQFGIPKAEVKAKTFQRNIFTKRKYRGIAQYHNRNGLHQTSCRFAKSFSTSDHSFIIMLELPTIATNFQYSSQVSRYTATNTDHAESSAVCEKTSELGQFSGVKFWQTQFWRKHVEEERTSDAHKRLFRKSREKKWERL
jgi:hypothetical protein